MNKTICLNKSVLDFIEKQISRDSYVVEFGAGWSSRWFADRCGKLVSIETSARWAAVARGDLSGAACEWDVRRSLTPLLVSKDLTGADLVLVDCEVQWRFDCATRGWEALRPGGWMILDDAQRQYSETIVANMSAHASPIELKWQEGDIETAKERLALAWQKPQ